MRGVEGGGMRIMFSGPRNASPQEISRSNYRARERKLFVPPFITLIDKTDLWWSRHFGGCKRERSGGELKGLLWADEGE